MGKEPERIDGALLLEQTRRTVLAQISRAYLANGPAAALTERTLQRACGRPRYGDAVVDAVRSVLLAEKVTGTITLRSDWALAPTIPHAWSMLRSTPTGPTDALARWCDPGSNVRRERLWTHARRLCQHVLEHCPQDAAAAYPLALYVTSFMGRARLQMAVDMLTARADLPAAAAVTLLLEIAPVDGQFPGTDAVAAATTVIAALTR